MRAPDTICSLILAAVALVGCQRVEAEALPPARGSGAPPRSALPTIASNTPQDGVMQGNRLVVTGTTHPIEEARVGPKSQGVIAALLVDEGDTVKKGQLLFRLDGAMQGHSVSQARAALASAEVAQTSANTDYQRTLSLRERGAVSQAVLDQMKARLDAAEMGVAQARAALGTAQQTSADTAVFAPIDGVVTERKANPGELPPPVVLTLQNISTLEVRARLPERALNQVRVGTPATVHFQTGAERTIKVERLSPSVDTKTRTFEVVALLPNPNHDLMAGMLVQVDFGPTVAASAASAVSSSVPATPSSARP